MTPMRRLLIIAPLLAAVAAHGGERGKIVITNNGNGITASPV